MRRLRITVHSDDPGRGGEFTLPRFGGQGPGSHGGTTVDFHPFILGAALLIAGALLYGARRAEIARAGGQRRR